MPTTGYRVRTDQYDRAKQERIDWRTVSHDPPSKEDQALRDSMATDLELFLRTCFPQAYSLEFSNDHLKVIDALYRTVTKGQKKAIAMPRGSGKTTMCTHTALFALLYNYRQYLFIVCADLNAAKNLIAGIKGELCYNEMLLRLFPEVATYFVATEGNQLRAKNQLNENGEPTGIACSSEKVVFPAVPGSACSEAVIEVAGITGRIRGSRHARMDGAVIRPDIVLIDDPQTEESANSDSQTEKRIKIIRSDVLGMSGPDTSISCMIACTVIAPGDLSSQMLDRRDFPEFRGERMQMVYEFPKKQAMWDKYVEMFREEGENDEDHNRSLEYYRANQTEMDEGAVVGWEHRYVKATELSAIQHAYNLLTELGENAFWSEYQNEPRKVNSSEYELDLSTVASRCNTLPRLTMHPDAQTITAHTDINYSGLHWSVMAHTSSGVQYIIDYGKYPEGRESLISEKEAKKFTELEIDQKIYNGLHTLHKKILLNREYMKDGNRVGIDMMGVDASFKMRTVVQFCNNMKIDGLPIMPTVGRAEKAYKPTHVIGSPGNGWHVSQQMNKIKTNAIWYNADIFRERMQRSFLQQPGGPGSISLFGKDPMNHKEFARHIIAEELVEKVVGEVETYYNWRPKPGSVWDWADTTTVNMVLGAATGCGPYRIGAGVPMKSKRARKKKKVKTGMI